ncbi:MAG: CDP-glycerol glycerophosphotransferase family protein, partial [Clostridia bacterium]|nr:CDP-glycerol glycerophosphotransferase family protein [Clostridia bacterium]
MKKLANIIKYFKFIYSLYYYVFSFLLSALRLFVKPDDKLILFNSFGGRKYDDSPKAIFEKMQKDPRFQDYKKVWAFHNPEGKEIPGVTCIKTDTFRYFVTALRARVWITNSSVERGLNFKGKNTYYFNTWHGTPIKK